MKRAPRSKYVYCSINAFLAGVIKNRSKMTLDQFPKVNLFGSWIENYSQWRAYRQDRGTGNLSITTRHPAVSCYIPSRRPLAATLQHSAKTHNYVTFDLPIP